MEGEQSPIIIVDETWFDLSFHCFGLAAEVGAYIGNFDRLTVFIHSFKSDLVGLGLPLPLVSGFEESGNIRIPGVADSLNFVPRIDPESLGDLIENWRTFLRPRVRTKDQHSAKQKTHHGETAGISHRLAPR